MSALRGSTARRYAEAILDLALERNELAEWRDGLDRVVASLPADTLRLLANPSLGVAARRAALEAAARDLPSGVRALLLTLLERERIRALPDIARAFHDLLDAREGIEKALITTAAPLADDDQKALVRRLEEQTERKLRAAFAVEPGLLGGALVRIGDREIDGSLRTRLALLREQLAATAS